MISAIDNILDNPLVEFALIAGCALVVLSPFAIVPALYNRRLDAAAGARYRKWLAAVQRSGGNLPEREAPIRLHEGEICYYAAPSAILLEPRAIRNGGFGGASIRVADGVSLHTGGIRGESHDEWRKITAGALYVTNERIIFDGDTQNRFVKLSDVMSVVPSPRAAVVNVQSKQRPLAFKAINGRIFATVVDTIADAL